MPQLPLSGLRTAFVVFNEVLIIGTNSHVIIVIGNRELISIEADPKIEIHAIIPKSMIKERARANSQKFRGKSFPPNTY